MGAIFFLFRRKFTYSARWVLLITGYDIRQKDFMERLYGVYIGIILAGWVLLMLAWAVSSVAQALAKTTLAGQLYTPLFYVLALWLAVTPWLAQRAYDLYRFSLPDLDFLANAPIKPQLIALSWFLKSLFTRLNGMFLLGTGVLAGAIGQLNGRGDLLGLLEGLAAGAMFVVSVWAFLWLLGLLRYRPVPALGALTAFGFSGVLLALLVLVPGQQQIFWPAWLTASLVSGHSPVQHWGTWAVAGLSVTALAGLIGVFLLSRTTLLAPAFEEGRLGGQLRRAASLGTLSAGEARMQSSLERRLARGAALPGVGASSGGGRSGVVGALLRKQQLRLTRLSLPQLLLTVLSPLLLGAVVSVGTSLLPRVAMRIEVLAPTTFLGAFLLMRSGVEILRSDLAHIEFFAGWPISRARLMVYDLVLGFALPLVGGEVIILAAGPGMASLLAVLVWLVLWPVLVAVAALAAWVDFRRLLGKWAATPETLPEIGPAPVVVVAVVWLIIVMGSASTALFG